MNKPTNVAIMTATITPPPGAPMLARTDPKLRMNDYRAALEFYLSCLGRGVDRIVFAENSNSDVQPLRDLVARSGHADRVEFVVFPGLDYPVELGRCYGELKLIDRALVLSKTIGELGQSYVAWKLTGRYKVANLPEMIRRRPKEFDVYCDLRNGHRGPWCDMRVMAWTSFGYQTALRGICEQMAALTHGPLLEVQMYLALLPRLRGCKAVTSYCVEPYIEGARGFDNKRWDSGRQWVVYHLRNTQRKVFGRAFV